MDFKQLLTRKSKTISRQHWADRIGLGRDVVKDRAFKKLYPFEPHHTQVFHHTMHHIDEGEGEPVVMVHGNPTWSFFYRGLVTALSKNHRCLAVDHLGCGLSDKPAKFEYTLEKHINNLERWLEIVLPPADWNGGKFNLIVHDWGGPIGLGYAARHPERINRVIIMNTSAFTAGTMPKRIKICRVPGLGALLVRGLNLFAEFATRQTTVKPLSAAVRNAYLMPYNNWANRIAVHRFVQDIPLKAGRTRELLGTIEKGLSTALKDKPILIQWGMRDWCFTKFFLELWREKFTHAEVDEYEDAGHYLLEDAGIEIAKRIKTFLQTPIRESEGEAEPAEGVEGKPS